MKSRTFFALLIVTFALPVCAQYPAIQSGRPRVYADSARLAWLRENVVVPGECKSTYDNFLYAYDNWWINDPQLYLLGSDSTMWTWDWSSQWAGSEAFYTAFIYKLTQDSLALKRCRFLAGQVSAYIDAADFPAMEWYAKENLRGRWIVYGAEGDYQYNVADAQLSYDSTKVTFFRRKLLYLKSDRIFVLDYLHLKNTETRQRDVSWIAHFVNRPSIDGETVAAPVPGHIETLNGNVYTVRNGNGSAAIKTLLPANSSVKVIGGDGYEYFVDGNNYPPLSVPDPAYYTPGAWRIEVRPARITDTLIYLHEIKVGDSSAVPVANGIALQSEYSIGAVADNSILFFSADGESCKTYHAFNAVAGGRIVEIIAADMLPGGYDVKVDGSYIEIVTADPNGILRSSANLASGMHFVEIVSTSSAIGEFDHEIQLQIYPNPVRDELTILSQYAALPDEIRIYNSIGKLMLVAPAPHRINVAGWSPGLYFVKVIHGDSARLLKFIKE